MWEAGGLSITEGHPSPHYMITQWGAMEVMGFGPKVPPDTSIYSARLGGDSH